MIHYLTFEGKVNKEFKEYKKFKEFRSYKEFKTIVFAPKVPLRRGK